jgi:hypothetical protein
MRDKKPFSKTDQSVKNELWNAVISQICLTPQDFSKEAMRVALKENYNDYIEGDLNHNLTLPKVLEQLYDYVVNGTTDQLVKNRKNVAYMKGILTWRDDVDEEVVVVKSELSDVARMPDYKFNKFVEESSSSQVFGMMNDLDDDEDNVKVEREAIAAAVIAEKNAAEEHKKKLEELQIKQLALKTKEAKIKSRNDTLVKIALEKGKKRAQEQDQDVPEPPKSSSREKRPKEQDDKSSKKSKTDFKTFYDTLDEAQKTELVEAGVCDKNGLFLAQQALNKKTREEFKSSQLNKLAELNVITKNF